MKDYASMSDQEINMHVAQIIYPESTVIESKSRPPCACIAGNIPNRWVDFCNNPADAWPILLGNKITIAAPLPQHEYWTAEKRDTDGGLLNFYVGANPLRCAMIVFLMMKGGE